MDRNDVNGAPFVDTSKSFTPGNNIGYGFDVAQRQDSRSSSLRLLDYATYIVKRQDTLSAISEKETGNPLNWTKFKELDGTNFTSQEATQLQIGSIVYIPKEITNGYISTLTEVVNSPAPINLAANPAPIVSQPSSLISMDAYMPLLIEAGNTLWVIAYEQFGDPQDWIAIREADGTNFTEAEARKLQIGSTVYLPKNLLNSLGKTEKTNDIVFSLTPDLTERLNSNQNRTLTTNDKLKDPDSPKDASSEDKLTIPNKPLSPIVQPNLGLTFSLDNVVEGKNWDTGLVKAVVVDDKLGGKYSFEIDRSPKDDEVKFAPLDPDYAPTLNLELDVKNFGKELTKEWETDIISNLLKLNLSDMTQGKGTGLSVKVGQWNGLDIWVSHWGSKPYDPEHGGATTAFKMTVEGDLTDALKKKKSISEELRKRLDLTKIKVELEYEAEIAWQAKPIPLPKPLLPQPVPVYVNDPLPSYTKPRQPVGINPYPINPPTVQPEIPPQPIEIPKPQLVTNVVEQPQSNPVQQTTSSSIVTDSSRDSNLIDNAFDAINSPAGVNMVIGATAVVGVGVAVVTSPVWVPALAAAGSAAIATTVTASVFAGLVGLSLWNSNGGEKA